MNSAEYSHTASWFKLTTVSELNTIPMIIVLMWLTIQPAHTTHLHNTVCGCMQVSGVIRSSMKIAIHIDGKKHNYVKCMVKEAIQTHLHPSNFKTNGVLQSWAWHTVTNRLQQMTRVVQWELSPSTIIFRLHSVTPVASVQPWAPALCMYIMWDS
jgi:hypothetical protein